MEKVGSCGFLDQELISYPHLVVLVLVALNVSIMPKAVPFHEDTDTSAHELESYSVCDVEPVELVM